MLNSLEISKKRFEALLLSVEMLAKESQPRCELVVLSISATKGSYSERRPQSTAERFDTGSAGSCQRNQVPIR